MTHSDHEHAVHLAQRRVAIIILLGLNLYAWGNVASILFNP